MTTMPPTDARLEAILASIGELLDIGDRDEADRVEPVTPLDAESSSVRPMRPDRRPVLLVAAAVVVVVLMAMVAITPAREAVADLLHIGSTRIERVPEPAATTTQPRTANGIVDGLDRIDTAAAAARLGRSLPDTTAGALGAPDATYAARTPADGVVLVWQERTTTLWIRRSPVGDAIVYAKQIGAQNGVEIVAGLGDSAIAITGPHTLTTPDRTVAAGNVVLWVRDRIEYRLEAGRPTSELIAIARAIRA